MGSGKSLPDLDMRCCFTAVLFLVFLLSALGEEIPKHDSIDQVIARGDLAAVKQLLKEHPDCARKGRHPSLLPLHQAILRRKGDIARLLIESGADLNAPDGSRRTPLHLCVERDLPELATVLLSAGAEPDALDKAGWTPLHNAAAKDRLAVAKALLHGGADPAALSKRGGTALHEAAASASAPMMCLLLENGVDPSVVATDGGTALDVALSHQNEVAIRLLSDPESHEEDDAPSR